MESLRESEPFKSYQPLFKTKKSAHGKTIKTAEKNNNKQVPMPVPMPVPKCTKSAQTTLPRPETYMISGMGSAFFSPR